MRTLAPIVDGGFILGGKSDSNPSGNKTAKKFGLNDFWTVRVDSLGNKLWDLSFGGNNLDDLFYLLQTSDGGFCLAGRSASPPSGNKTNANYGGYDVWVVKLSPEQPTLRILPQSLSSILANGYRFYLNGTSNAYAIEWSGNLTNWTRLQTNIVSTTGNEIEVTDHSAGLETGRYYRAYRLK